MQFQPGRTPAGKDDELELPTIVITGASGFVGRHLIDALKGRYKIFAIARRTQRQCGAPVHPNILWHRVDIGDIEPLEAVFKKIRDSGGAEIFIHLAAYYDFSGEEHPEYWRTNVVGLKNVLDLCKSLKLKRFIFASSTAACEFPQPGKLLDENSPPDGDHIYARTKREGEEMLRKYSDSVPYCTIRFAALFSDWCEYPPVYMFIGSWLSDTMTSRVLGGKGQSSVPYLHIRDLIDMLKRVMERIDTLDNGEVLVASTDGSVTHHQLFEAATLAYFGQRKKPLFLPKLLCKPGILIRGMLGHVLGYKSFESTWMCSYIDRQMNIDASHTREKLGWKPRPRLEMLRRIPFIIENYRAEPAEWHQKNTAALKEIPLMLHLKIHNIMKTHSRRLETALIDRVTGPEGKERFPSYQNLPDEQKQWSAEQLLLQLRNSIRTRDKNIFRTYSSNLAEHRFEQGFSVKEVCDAYVILNKVCIEILGEDPEVKKLPRNALKDYITMTIQFGVDEVLEVFEQWGDVDYQPEMLSSLSN